MPEQGDRSEDVADSGKQTENLLANMSLSETFATAAKLSERDWFIGRIPQTVDDFMRELDLRDDAWARTVEEAKPRWKIGKQPKNSDEMQLEAQLRELDRRWEVEAGDRKHRADLEFQGLQLNRKGENVRATVLIFVVAAVVAYPLIAMLANESASDFGQFIAPITGIAGTVIGYWFGSRGQSSTMANAPLTPPRSGSSTGPD